MAKYDLIAGGIVGKLGDTVGQRWRNRRILRSYAIPKDPHTVKQEQVRQWYRKATALAQQAKEFNYHADVWKSEKMTEENGRYRLAYKRVQKNISKYASLPLYPESTVPNHTIADIEVRKTMKDNDTIYSKTVATLDKVYQFAICLLLYSQTTGELVPVFFKMNNTVGSGTLYTLPASSDLEITDGCIIMGITTQTLQKDFCSVMPHMIGTGGTTHHYVWGEVNGGILLQFTQGERYKLYFPLTSVLEVPWTFRVDYEAISIFTGEKETHYQSNNTISKTRKNVSLGQSWDLVLWDNCQISFSNVTPQGSTQDTLTLLTIHGADYRLIFKDAAATATQFKLGKIKNILGYIDDLSADSQHLTAVYFGIDTSKWTKPINSKWVANGKVTITNWQGATYSFNFDTGAEQDCPISKSNIWTILNAYKLPTPFLVGDGGEEEYTIDIECELNFFNEYFTATYPQTASATLKSGLAKIILHPTLSVMQADAYYRITFQTEELAQFTNDIEFDYTNTYTDITDMQETTETYTNAVLEIAKGYYDLDYSNTYVMKQNTYLTFSNATSQGITKPIEIQSIYNPPTTKQATGPYVLENSISIDNIRIVAFGTPIENNKFKLYIIHGNCNIYAETGEKPLGNDIRMIGEIQITNAAGTQTYLQTTQTLANISEQAESGKEYKIEFAFGNGGADVNATFADARLTIKTTQTLSASNLFTYTQTQKTSIDKIAILPTEQELIQIGNGAEYGNQYAAYFINIYGDELLGAEAKITIEGYNTSAPSTRVTREFNIALPSTTSYQTLENTQNFSVQPTNTGVTVDQWQISMTRYVKYQGIAFRSRPKATEEIDSLDDTRYSKPEKLASTLTFKQLNNGKVQLMSWNGATRIHINTPNYVQGLVVIASIRAETTDGDRIMNEWIDILNYGNTQYTSDTVATYSKDFSNRYCIVDGVNMITDVIISLDFEITIKDNGVWKLYIAENGFKDGLLPDVAIT